MARVVEGRPDEAWMLRHAGYDPVIEREIESRLSIGNGFLGVRASLEMPTLASRPRTFIAGLFDDVVGVAGSPFLTSAPDWVRLAISVDGRDVELPGADPDHVRTLDMRAGVLRSAWKHRLPSGGFLSLDTLRLTSLADRMIALQVVRLQVDRPGTFELEALLVPTTLSLVLEGIEGDVSYWRTAESRRGLVIAMCAQLSTGGAPLAAEDGAHRLARRWTWHAAPGEVASLVRTTGFARCAREEMAQRAHTVIAAARQPPAVAFDAHLAVWDARWRASDVQVEGDADARHALRYAAYQLISAAHPQDERVSVGARGLTGDAYSGHVFWDTEIFLLPFYTFTWPEAARAMLMYRYHTLPAARAKASRLGFGGALYAWESADTGDEATPEHVQMPNGRTVPVLCGRLEHHISADIAFAVCQYWEATGDEEFLLDAGAEILLETARFWSTRAVLEADGLHHIRNVIGPDEYHERIDDNAYTNVMAQWNLEAGAAVARLLQSRWPERWTQLAARMRLTDAEVARWDEAARAMYTGYDHETRLFEQFSGFFRLEAVDLAAYEPRDASMSVILGPERTQRSQVIKQADVVMLLALLPARFSGPVTAANFRYYEPRCGHGSSLSPPVHALVAARLGELPLAERYFHETAAIDLGDAMGNAAGGVHMAALAGLWQAAILGFAGMTVTGDCLSFRPHLPAGWRSMSFAVRYRGCSVDVSIAQDPAVVRARMEGGSRAITLEVAGVRQTLAPGAAREWAFTIPDQSSEVAP
jgi:trehalose/maltose hydrolase-like predicted phosphorylase